MQTISLQFGDLRLLAQDYGAQARFYRDVLELPLDQADEQLGYAQFKCGALVLAIFEQQSMAEIVAKSLLPAAPAGQDCFAISFAATDVDTAFDWLIVKGVAKATDPHNQED